MESSNSKINDSVNDPIQIKEDENGTNPNSSSSPSPSPQQHSNDEINNGDDDHLKSSSDALAKGLSSMLSSVIKDFDSKAQDTLNSQDQLALALDRLTRELDKLLEDAPLPFIMQHASKISGVRKRVSSLNSVLRSIQKRVDNIDRTLSVGMRHENAAAEVSGQN